MTASPQRVCTAVHGVPRNAQDPRVFMVRGTGVVVAAVELSMRLAFPSSAALCFTTLATLATLSTLATLTGCGVDVTSEPAPAPAAPPTVAPPATQPAKPPAAESMGQPTVAPPREGAFAEVVYVFMKDQQARLWFCTGTLVAKTTVVTAAHCLDQTMFVSYEIVAPGAPSKPRVAATKPTSFSTGFEDVANPDIGFLTLSKPVELSAYAELTDVTARVDAGEQLSVAAVVRTAEKAEAPLQQSASLPLSSTVELGYEHGFGTPMFTNGGDSGAGLFLVENGERTHKLVGVARQPEPARSIDHFTRIDASFLAWYAAQNPGGSPPPR
jgi:hypothetical protein